MEHQNEEQKNKYELKKEGKERGRREAERKAAKKKFKKAAIWAGVVIVLAGLGAGFIYFANYRVETLPGTEFPEQPPFHISVDESHPPYNSNPPTSGWHYPSPVENGVYGRQVADEFIVHNLEHGHIWISYKDPDDTELIQKLEEIVKEDDWKVILTPRPENDAKIVLAAWRRLLNLDEFDEDAIKNFIKRLRNKGPERTAN